MPKRAIFYGWIAVGDSARIACLGSFAIGGAAAWLALAFRPPRPFAAILEVAPTAR